MAIFMTEQSARNMEYVRKLLKQKQPRFAAALELAVDLAERELSSPELVRDVSAGQSFMTSNPLPRAAGNVASRVSRRSEGAGAERRWPRPLGLAGIEAIISCAADGPR
jgi:hypothetical protein